MTTQFRYRVQEPTANGYRDVSPALGAGTLSAAKKIALRGHIIVGPRGSWYVGPDGKLHRRES